MACFWLAQLYLVWFGLGPVPIVVITFLVAFFPMVVNATVGLADVERDLLDLTRVLRLNWWRVLWSIRFPSALPPLPEEPKGRATTLSSFCLGSRV